MPSVIIDYEDDKENMPDESDYEDLPSMYKDEDDEVDDDEDDDEDDDSIFTSEWRLCNGLTSRGRVCFDFTNKEEVGFVSGRLI